MRSLFLSQRVSASSTSTSTASKLMSQLPLLLLLQTLTTLLVSAHGNHGNAPSNNQDQAPINVHAAADAAAAGSDWATTHMASEHHITSFDAPTFFTLHDYDGDGLWEADEMLRTYGMAPGSTDGVGGPGALNAADKTPVSAEQKRDLVRDVLARFDTNHDSLISRDEWAAGWDRGERLRDWATGPGHHGDDELEYEIHHFERFHDENTTEEELTHPEDLAHFAAHERREAEEEAAEQERRSVESRGRVIERNIPGKFRKAGR